MDNNFLQKKKITKSNLIVRITTCLSQIIDFEIANSRNISFYGKKEILDATLIKWKKKY